jgi:hypothetical protein
VLSEKLAFETQHNYIPFLSIYGYNSIDSWIKAQLCSYTNLALPVLVSVFNCICCVFNDADKSSGYAASSYRMINEK